MEAYFDNCIESGRVRTDLQPSEMAAARSLLKARDEGKIELVTSRESWREQDRTKDPTRRAQLAESRGATPVVPNDHKLLGFHNQMDRLGTVAVTPFITEIIDEGLFKSLTTAGLKDADARHLMYAAGNGCDRFVRLDNRHRNKDGEISHKHGNTLIRTLRKIYGQGFDQYSRRISNPNLRKETFFSSRWDQDKRWQIPSWPS